MSKRLFYNWLPLAVAITLVSGMIYGVAQYQLRAGANDPQIALVEDGVQKLNNGGSVNDVVSKDLVDIAQSLSTFVMINDSSGAQQDSSVVFNGKPISIPAGVLAYARRHGQDHVTWQPSKDVRIALVVESFKTGTVSAGRSLREVEIRENWLIWAVAISWLITMMATLTTMLVIDKLKN